MTDIARPERVTSLGTVVDTITNLAMQAVSAELRRQGKGRLEDSRLLQGAVREIVRRNLRNVSGAALMGDGASVSEPEPSAQPVSACTLDDQNLSVACAQIEHGQPWSSPLVVRPRDACQMLSVGLTRLYELLHEGALESYLHRGARRITVASIHAYIERRIAASRSQWNKPE